MYVNVNKGKLCNLLDDLTEIDHFTSTLKLFLILNFLDACFTIVWIIFGTASELNPFMNEALKLGGPPLFIFVKISIGILGVLICWIYRNMKFTRVIFILPAIIYSVIIGTHIGIGINMLLGHQEYLKFVV